MTRTAEPHAVKSVNVPNFLRLHWIVIQLSLFQATWPTMYTKDRRG